MQIIIMDISRYSCDNASSMNSSTKYMMTDPKISGRGQMLPGGTEYDDVKRINNGDVSTARSVGGPQYFVLDQQYVSNRDDVRS